MKKIITLILLIFSFFGFISFANAQEEIPEQTIPVPDQYAKALVIYEPSETILNEYGQTIIRQRVPITIISGPDKETEMELDFDIRENTPGVARLEVGDKLVVGKSMIAGEEIYYISDVYRLHGLWTMLAIFFVLIFILARWAGVRALLGLMVSFGIIIWFIIPRIMDGQNALVVGFIGTIAIATMSLYIAHDFRSRTSIAFVSTIITIFISLLLAIFFTNMMHLFGLGSEEAFFLQTSPGTILNLRGILLAGIIIGTLGVLDDITTAQAAVVEELHLANPSFDAKGLFKRGSSVGREHIISLVNTLVLAYTGASLPLLLLFQVYERPTWLILNSEIIMEEIVRMLIGSIALALAVPLTTYLASWYYANKSIYLIKKYEK
jgi:uncharacterized membrane protein